MKCPQKHHPYYEAFYGILPQDHIYERVNEGFIKMVKKFKADLVEKFPDLPNPQLKEGILYGLETLQKIGAKSPNAYFSHTDMATQAFRAACNRVAALQKHDMDLERAQNYELVGDEELQQLQSKRERVRARLLVQLENHIKVAIATGKQGVDAKIIGFCELLKENPNPQGYAYFLLSLKLPVELEIYDEERVISAHNAHSAFAHLKREPSFKSNYGNAFLGGLR